MVASVKRHKAFLYMLKYAGTKKAARIQILSDLNPGELKVILELAANTLHGVIPLSRAQKKVLRAIKPFILSLLSSDMSLQNKKNYVIKHHAQTYTFIDTIFNTLQRLVWHLQ